MTGPTRRKGKARKTVNVREVLKDEKSGIEYIATGAQDEIPKPAKEKDPQFTFSNYIKSTIQSFFDAAFVMVILLGIIGAVWYISAHPAMQEAVRASRVLHGTVDVLKRHPTEESAWPYMTNLFLWRWMVGDVENQAIFQQEGGLDPFLDIVREDKNFVLTRMTLAGMKTALETSYNWEPQHRAILAEILVGFLRKGDKGVAQQTAASILTSLLGRDSDFRSIIVDQLEALSDIEAVAAWSEDEGLLEAITKAAAASIPAAESTLEAGFQDPQKAAR